MKQSLNRSTPVVSSVSATEGKRIYYTAISSRLPAVSYNYL